MLSFYGFMMQHTQDKTAIGALARYMEQQPSFPRSANYQDNLDQLHMNGVSEFLLETFDRAYEGPYTEYMKNDQRVRDALKFRNDVFDRTNCTHDDGEIRSQFKQRPELTLLALIAKGLFEVADNLKDINKTLHR